MYHMRSVINFLIQPTVSCTVAWLRRHIPTQSWVLCKD